MEKSLGELSTSKKSGVAIGGGAKVAIKFISLNPV
jgi:hypothetical protein